MCFQRWQPLHEELNEAFEKCKTEVLLSMQPMERQLVTINKALIQIDTCSGEVFDQSASIGQQGDRVQVLKKKY